MIPSPKGVASPREFAHNPVHDADIRVAPDERQAGMTNLKQGIGLDPVPGVYPDPQLVQYLNLKLASLGLPTVAVKEQTEFHEMMANLLAHQRETERLLSDYLCPADQRLQKFLNDYLKDTGLATRIPGRTLGLDRYGLARALSLPPERDEFISDLVRSYRVHQGVLHNPQSDRRTTEGTFHVAEGGLPIPADKLAVRQTVFARLLQQAFAPPPSLLRLPFTSAQSEEAHCLVSLLIRPVVCPEVPGFTAEKAMEIRFFAPGALVSNLDFVESIFGNAGNPYLPENDAALDPEHWTGHTGCVILAPHLAGLTKRSLGLPSWEEATERERRDGMCWKKDSDLYNDGSGFKLTARDERGLIVTLIADNYFGYCKKEVKTQISYSANLFGLCEEEHAGGTLAYPTYDLGEEFSGYLHVKPMGHTFEEVVSLYGEVMDLQPGGYGIDKRFRDILYVSENALFDLHNQTVSWPAQEGPRSTKLLPGKTYVRPSGYKVRMERSADGRNWRLVGVTAEGLLCHKPCTVSGGGKSEISKPITDAILQGPVFLADFKRDFDRVSELISRDYTDRFKGPLHQKNDRRSILSAERSLGSVIKLLTPARRDYTAKFNAWLATIPQYIKELVFVVKRCYKPDWGDRWREHFSVDIINGTPGNELKCDNRKLVAHYVRVGYDQDGAWRTFGLRQDFYPAAKQSLEDDISASIVVPRQALKCLNPQHKNPSVKFVQNCEYRFFQRPDEAVHRGYDKQTEADFSRPGNFFSNYEPLPLTRAGELIEDSIGFARFTVPMQQLIRQAAQNPRPSYFVCNAFPRLIKGKPTKNPRYLQIRPDLIQTQDAYLATMATRMHRRLPLSEPVLTPVNAVVPGRRNHPPDPAAGVRPLCVYNPIHYLALPELFMEFIASMTGKSPSTTGAGSEGAMTKGPFNALWPIIDLNNALVSYLLTGYHGFVTAAGYVGPQARMDHDVSLLIPEIWCRMLPEERDPRYLIENGYLEKCPDLTFEGRSVPSSRLGYRITPAFVRNFFGRVFNHPHVIFTDGMLKPELQDLAVFVAGMDNIVQTQQRVAQLYFEDGSVELACPPLKALLHIMRHGHFEKQGLEDPELRALFTREYLLASDWYAERLQAKQDYDVHLWRRHIQYLEEFLAKTSHAQEAVRIGIPDRLEAARQSLSRVQSAAYLQTLQGTLGLQPLRARKGIPAGPVPPAASNASRETVATH
jgi:phosphoenolpyruvate carboxykinase (diphosphate)